MALEVSGSLWKNSSTATPTGTKRSGFAWGASRGTVRAALATRQWQRASRRLLRCDDAVESVVGGTTSFFTRPDFCLASVLHAAKGQKNNWSSLVGSALVKL